MEFICKSILIFNVVINTVGLILFFQHKINNIADINFTSWWDKSCRFYEMLFKGNFYKFSFFSFFLVIVTNTAIVSSLYFCGVDETVSLPIQRCLVILAFVDLIPALFSMFTLIFIVAEIITANSEIDLQAYYRLKEDRDPTAKSLLLKNNKITKKDIFLIKYFESAKTDLKKNLTEKEIKKQQVKNEIKNIDTSCQEIETPEKLPSVLIIYYFLCFLLLLPFVIKLCADRF